MVRLVIRDAIAPIMMSQQWNARLLIESIYFLIGEADGK